LSARRAAQGKNFSSLFLHSIKNNQNDCNIHFHSHQSTYLFQTKKQTMQAKSLIIALLAVFIMAQLTIVNGYPMSQDRDNSFEDQRFTLRELVNVMLNKRLYMQTLRGSV
jgi:hypothetical protein